MSVFTWFIGGVGTGGAASVFTGRQTVDVRVLQDAFHHDAGTTASLGRLLSLFLDRKQIKYDDIPILLNNFYQGPSYSVFPTNIISRLKQFTLFQK